MATNKLKTNAKRPTSSRSVHVTKKKQGVTKKQGLFAAALLAAIGVVVVVASQAATTPNKVYVLTNSTTGGAAQTTINRVASDASSRTAYQLPYTWNIDLARDKTIFSASRGGNDFSIIKASDGTELSSVTCPIDANCFSSRKVWLPGSKRFAYHTEPAGLGTGIQAINSDGTGYKAIVPANSRQFNRCLSINKAGTKLLFSQTTAPDTGFSLTTINSTNLDGTGRKVLTSLEQSKAEALYGCPSWSPDGTKVAFGRLKGENSSGIPYSADIRLIKADGTGLTTVKTVSTNKATGDWVSLGDTMAWSPGGSSLVYKASLKNIENIYQINISTKKTVAMTSNTSTSTGLGKFGWSSDGRIIYSYGTKGTSGTMNTIKSINADRTSAKLIYQASGTNKVTHLEF